jgi:hypothetical protein
VCLVGRGAAVKERYDANQAALSQARRIVRHAVHVLNDLGEDRLHHHRATGPADHGRRVT